MSDYPVWWDATITIYNKYEDAVTKKITWYRNTVSGCFLKTMGNKVTINDTVIETDNVLCRIREDARFLKKAEWLSKPNDEKGNFFTLSEDDIIVYGEVQEDIDEYTSGQRSSDFIKKHKALEGCMQVEAVALNVGAGRVHPHYLVKGI